MAVQAAQDARLASACHLQGGIDAWKKADGPLDAMKSRQKVALITGAAHGIGRATARQLLDDGWLVGAVDVSGPDLERAFGKQARRVAHDRGRHRRRGDREARGRRRRSSASDSSTASCPMPAS